MVSLSLSLSLSLFLSLHFFLDPAPCLFLSRDNVLVFLSEPLMIFRYRRQVLADVLGIPDRVDWKACMLPQEEDKADVEAFKAAFASFDPSL